MLAESGSHLDAGPLQSTLELHCIGQRGTGISCAMQQQHRRHQVGVLSVVHAVGGGQHFELSLALEAHDAVEEGVVEAPLVEVLPQVCAVVHPRNPHQALHLGGIPLWAPPKYVLLLHCLLCLHNTKLVSEDSWNG